MGALNVLLDTNILIDALGGHEAAIAYLDSIEAWKVSVVTQIEVLAGSMSIEDEGNARLLLRNCEILALDPRVAELAATVRRNERLKLPDAVILASAIVNDAVLATRNTKDFGTGDSRVLVPYEL